MAANLSIMNNILAVSAVSAGLPLSSCALLCKPYCKLCYANFMSSHSSETSQHNWIMDGGRVKGSMQMKQGSINKHAIPILAYEQTSNGILDKWKCHQNLILCAPHVLIFQQGLSSFLDCLCLPITPSLEFWNFCLTWFNWWVTEIKLCFTVLWVCLFLHIYTLHYLLSCYLVVFIYLFFYVVLF